MKLLPYAIVGVFWAAAYVLVGWAGIAWMVAAGIAIEILIFGSAQLRDRRRLR